MHFVLFRLSNFAFVLIFLILKIGGRPDTGLSGRIPDNAGHRAVRRPVSGRFSETGHVRRPVLGKNFVSGRPLEST